MNQTHSFSIVRLLSIVSVAVSLSGCGNSDFFFTLAPTADKFAQSSVKDRINTIDILWVMDNSGSMANLQANVAANMNNFMSAFLSQGYDFQMAVTTTDAYKYYFPPNDINVTKFRDGLDSTSHTGQFIVNSKTVDPVNTFITNIMEGITGSGDERAFSSMQAAIDSPLNSGFVRRGGYLAVIIVSDEDDFSHDDDSLNEDYAQPTLHSIQSYVDYLDGITGSTARFRRYNVSAVGTLTQACLDANPGKKLGKRYIALADATQGLKVDICSPTFSQDLSKLQSYLVEILTQFFLTRTPNEATISVIVDGRAVPNDPTNGWTYASDTNSIRFHGSEVPAIGSEISVNYDPASVKQ